jgi:microcystin-dependent protein
MDELALAIARHTEIVADWERKIGTMFFDPTERDVEVKLLDDGGNIVTVTVPNLAKSTANIETIPVATVIALSGPEIPEGWLECNGAELSRSAYADLYAAIGTSYGPGDGSSTFNLPDLRGEFLRGLDNGRGVDDGRSLGSAQGDTIRNISGSIAGNYLSSSPEAEDGALFGTITQTNNRYAYSGGIYWGGTVNIDASRQVPTADENRPRNIAMIYAIKY